MACVYSSTYCVKNMEETCNWEVYTCKMYIQENKLLHRWTFLGAGLPGFPVKSELTTNGTSNSYSLVHSQERKELAWLPRAAQSHWNRCPAELNLGSGRSGWDVSALLSLHASFHSVSRAASSVAGACFHCSNPEINFVLPKVKSRAKVLGETRRR